MSLLKYQDLEIHSREGESVLDALLRHGVDVPFSCRNGICHVCMQQCVHGDIPPAAQRGLQPEQLDRGYFMPCKCIPVTDMEIAPPTELYTTTLVHSKEMLSPNVCKLLLEPPQAFTYRAGQFINLKRSDGITRSYSLASLPVEDYFLEIHVQRKSEGLMSNWILDDLNAGDELDIQGANGECYYKEKAHAQPMLLVGSGTGLAPLFGIIRDALHNQHKNEIHLYHGSRDGNEFYLRERMRQLERLHPNFIYHEFLSDQRSSLEDTYASRLLEQAFQQHNNLLGWHVYLAGPTQIVDGGEIMAAERGAMPEAIYTDAFALRNLRRKSRENQKSEPNAGQGDKAKYPPPNLELWAALRNGELLMEALKDFYGQVFQDDRLSSFFHSTTMQRSIEKQYLFMRQILTGEKIYIGDRPRNSHHWMVISDELFDYRAELMMSCLRKHGLSEPMVRCFHEVEEFYRSDIVKPTPFARVMGDVEVPFEGFNEMTLDVGTLCDTCEREVAVGEKVIYHVRIGKVYCANCSSLHNH